MKLVISLALTLSAACSTTSSLDGQGDTGHPGEVSSPREARGEKVRKKAPLLAKLVGPDAPDLLAPIPISLQVERPTAIPNDIDVEIRLPEGVLLRTGDLKRKLAKNARAARDELHFELVTNAMPASDVIVVLDVHGQGFGYHAELPYRFGRPEPTKAAPEASGADVKVGTRNFGKAVPVQR